MSSNKLSLILIVISHLTFFHSTLSCQFPQIDSIAFVDSIGFSYLITSRDHFWILNHLNDENVNEYYPSGLLPNEFIADAAVVKDFSGCNDTNLNEHSVILTQLSQGTINYISFNINEYKNARDKHDSESEFDSSKFWSKPNKLSDDNFLGKAKIDYGKSVDAMFSISGVIYLIQGPYYYSVGTEHQCPESIKASEKYLLSKLNVTGKIDAAYFSSNEDSLYLIEKKKFYKISNLNHDDLELKGTTTEHPIQELNFITKLCLPMIRRKSDSPSDSPSGPSSGPTFHHLNSSNARFSFIHFDMLLLLAFFIGFLEKLL